MDIERIRQLAREQGVDLAVQGLVCLPQNMRKYMGSVTVRRQQKSGIISYSSQVKYKGFYCSKSLKTKAEAEQYIRKINVREGIPIKNKFIAFEDRLEVELPCGKTFICDVEDLPFIEMHNWWCSNGYVATEVNGNTQRFHNIIMMHVPNAVTVDHINLNKLDNRKSNLRLVDRRIQNINRSMNSNNKTGITGVRHEKRSGAWVAEWRDIDGNRCSKSFGSKKYGNDIAKAKAIEHRSQMIRSLPHYVNALQLDGPQA